MSLKLVIPRDPLIFRDGKPFTAVPGERSRSLPFPYPATLAGAIRTRIGTDPNTGRFEKSQSEINELKELATRGPFLVELSEKGKITKWFFPAPADALLVTEDKITTRYLLAPLDVAEDKYSIQDKKLKLIGPKGYVKAKPTYNLPLYWAWELVQQWLLNPPDEETIDLDTFDAIHGPKRETRTHVSIDPKTQGAVSGALFQTSGMEFIQLKRNEDESPYLSKSRQLALAVATSDRFTNGVDFLGGERRVIHWESSDETLPVCPAEIVDKIKNDKHCRLILATPGSFDDGFIPAKLIEYVEAVALPRYQTISGWDYDKKAPKPTRRLAPSGSVYFLDLKKVNNIDKFIEDNWLNNSISDDEQSQRDGFGLALLGAWDGQLRTMKFGGSK